MAPELSRGFGEMIYRLVREVHGNGWVIGVDGRVARSLPYGQLNEAVATATELAARHPPSEVVVDVTTTLGDVADPLSGALGRPPDRQRQP